MTKETLECRFGHVCTSGCGNDFDCPCQAEHCCALTEDCDGSCDDCFSNIITKEDEEELTKQKRQEEADDCDREEALQF